jgi:hypothetical protein
MQCLELLQHVQKLLVMFLQCVELVIICEQYEAVWLTWTVSDAIFKTQQTELRNKIQPF